MSRELSRKLAEINTSLKAHTSLSSDLLGFLEDSANAVREAEQKVSMQKKTKLVGDLLSKAGVDISADAVRQSFGFKDGDSNHSIQARLAADAYERMKIESVSLTGKDRNHGVVISILLPGNIASKFPDPVEHNHGHPPHLTALYVAPEMSMGQASTVLHRVRAAARTVPPFRVFGDAQGGLQTFGDTDNGEKAIWVSARSDPRGEIERLHRVLRMSLETEGIEIQSHNSFRPHITWSYVPNGVTDKEIRRMDGHLSDRFPHGFWFDVRHLHMSMPNGSVKAIALSPVPRKSLY